MQHLHSPWTPRRQHLKPAYVSNRFQLYCELIPPLTGRRGKKTHVVVRKQKGSPHCALEAKAINELAPIAKTTEKVEI